MTLQDVHSKAMTYVGQQLHNAQHSYMLYLFIIESLMDTLKTQVLLYEEDCMLMNAGASMKDDPTLLKRLIMLTCIVHCFPHQESPDQYDDALDHHARPYHSIQ